jgi:hypothetical protein
MTEQEELELLRRFLLNNFDVRGIDDYYDAGDDDILRFECVYPDGSQSIQADEKDSTNLVYAYLRAHRQARGYAPLGMEHWQRQANIPEEDAVTEDTDRALVDAYVRAYRENLDAKERAEQKMLEARRQEEAKERAAREAAHEAEARALRLEQERQWEQIVAMVCSGTARARR